MAESDDKAELNRQRASDIFQNIFSEIFLANCGNPIDFNMTKMEIEKQMKLKFDEAGLWNFEKLFNEADENNVRDPIDFFLAPF